MTTSLLLNAISAVAIRLVIPWDGAWFAEVDLDPELPVLPPGPAILTIGTTTLRGFIDPAAQGTFGAKASCRVVAGVGGWSKTVPPQHFHNDAGVLSSQVIAVTAAIVGELATVLVPLPLGVDYVRAAGPASRVLEGLDWHVDFTGTTIVGARIPVPANPLTVEVLDFDPTAQRATIACDDVVAPGLILVDPRFGTLTIRDVEQTWTASGARATAWCGPSNVTRLAGAMRKFVREAAGIAHLKLYRYRIVIEGVDGRLSLQPVNILGDMPPTLPISVWPGMSGLSAKLTPSTEVLVAFIEGDPAQPVVLGFSSTGTPIELDLNATTIKLGLGLQPIALATQVNAALSALQTEIAAVSGAMVAAFNITGPITSAHATAAGAGTAAVGVGAGAVSAASALVPSIRASSD